MSQDRFELNVQLSTYVRPYCVEPYARLKNGDLQRPFETEVVNAPPSKARDDMISLMNIWCGNVNMECAYALYHYLSKDTTGSNGDLLRGELAKCFTHFLLRFCNLDSDKLDEKGRSIPYVMSGGDPKERNFIEDLGWFS